MYIEKPTFAHKIADQTTNFIGSWLFICIQFSIITIWVITNSIGIIKIDPYPFIFLNLALSFQAAFTAPIIMMSQNRQAKRDRLIQQIDYQTDKKAESEISYIINELKDIRRDINKKL
ncbi:MAG: DUF1003 domain-containing protein [Patescibacteria group bacterium]